MKHVDGFPVEWAGGIRSGTVCGAGSAVGNMRQVMKHVPRVLYSEYGHVLNSPIEGPKIIEIGCGDLNFAKACGLLISDYHGYDILKRDTWDFTPIHCKLKEIDINKVASFDADVIIARDVFIHLPTVMVQQLLSKMRYSILFSTIYLGADNKNRALKPSAGFQPLDLRKPPFNMKCELLIQEHDPDKYLGVFYA